MSMIFSVFAAWIYFYCQVTRKGDAGLIIKILLIIIVDVSVLYRWFDLIVAQVWRFLFYGLFFYNHVNGAYSWQTMNELRAAITSGLPR
jgi:hypothetical protein